MLDNVIGLLLLGLGLNKSIYTPNPNVKGDETEISQELESPEDNVSPTPGFKPRPLQNTFRLNPKSFENEEGDGRLERTASRTANRGIAPKRIFDAKAFGMGVMKMQENFDDQVEASREAAKKEFEDHKVQFKQQLALIRDTKKKAVVERLNANCQDINEKRTEKMGEMLTKLTQILTNVSNKAAAAAAAGKDTTTVDTAITAAQSAISDAQTAVTSQAGSTCTITITGETNLKTDVGKVISGLQQSMKTTYATVLTAKKAVGDAIRALAAVTGETLEKTKPVGTATGSGIQ